MSLNLSKGHHLIFKSDCTSHENHIGENELDTKKDLGIIVLKNITWSANCEQRVSKGRGALFQTCQNRPHCHQN